MNKKEIREIVNTFLEGFEKDEEKAIELFTNKNEMKDIEKEIDDEPYSVGDFILNELLLHCEKQQSSYIDLDKAIKDTSKSFQFIENTNKHCEKYTPKSIKELSLCSSIH